MSALRRQRRCALKAIEVYAGSDGDLTKRYYAELQKRGVAGEVAVCLFRAQKCSCRAKLYHGGIRGKGRYKDMAYDRKSWSMGELCKILKGHAHELGIVWGWKEDPGEQYASWVLYVDLSGFGQVSFHSPTRGEGPDYPGDWDGVHASEERILAFADAVFSQQGVTA